MFETIVPAKEDWFATQPSGMALTASKFWKNWGNAAIASAVQFTVALPCAPLTLNEKVPLNVPTSVGAKYTVAVSF